MRLTNRNVLIGLATAENDNIGGTGHPNIVQIKGNGTGKGLVVGNSAGAGRINIHDRRGENTITNGNELAFIGLGGGSPGINRAAIRAFADFESQDNAQRRGGELRLGTASNGSADTTDRFAIDRSGNVTCGGTIGTSPATTLNNDGTSFFTNLMTITRAGNAMRVNSTGAGNRDTIELGNEISDGRGNRIASLRNLVLGADKNNARGADASNIIFETDSSEKGRILGSGQYLIGGATAARQSWRRLFQTSPLQIETADSIRAGLSITWNRNSDALGPHLAFGRSRGEDLGDVDLPQKGDTYGDIWSFGADGVDMATPATRIRFWTGDETPARNLCRATLVSIPLVLLVMRHRSA